MNGARTGLLVVVLSGSLGAWAWMFLRADVQLRGSLVLLTLAFTFALTGAFVHYRRRLQPRLLTSNLALGALVHTVAAAVVVAGDRLGALGLVPALAANGGHFLLGLLGMVAAAVTWTRARGRPEEGPPPVVDAALPPEPPPAPVSALDVAPDWAALAAELAVRPDALVQLEAWRRVALALSTPDEARRVVHQEVARLRGRVTAEVNAEDDALSQAAALLEWGAQKLPELSQLDVSDLLMAKVIADIRAQADRVERRFIDHRRMHPIHPITRDTADDKVEARADAVRAALPALEVDGMRLSEDRIAADPALASFRSVTGFQVVDMGGGRFVTFEGNGRREALQRALGDRALEVEARHYVFDDPTALATIRRRVDRVRRWKGIGSLPE